MEKELIKSIQSLKEEINSLKQEIEKNNKIVEQKTNNEKELSNVKHDVVYFIRRYIQEVLEASFGLFAVMLITKREFELNELIKIACIIGFVTLILEEYNLNYSENFKQGMHFTIGAAAFGG